MSAFTFESIKIGRELMFCHPFWQLQFAIVVRNRHQLKVFDRNYFSNFLNTTTSVREPSMNMEVNFLNILIETDHF